MTAQAISPHAAAAPLNGYQLDSAVNVYVPRARQRFSYNDGDLIEQRIQQIVAGAQDVTAGSDELVQHICDWPTLYHLTPSRANLMRPLEPLLQNRRVLELGSGCGAISRYLGELGCDLTCVEGSYRRASITASRCRGLPNVRVVNDNFQNFRDSSGGYDIVTFIGVLEYSRTFLNSDDPVAAALALARSFLKPGGKVVIAIENKLGLKYFAGAPEDHLCQPFVGLHDLYGERTAVTFGRSELDQLLGNAGFLHRQFLYPYPDYKLPSLVLAEPALDEAPEMLRNLVSTCHAPDQAQRYERTFSDSAALLSLADNRLLGELANSFLVVASTQEDAPAPCTNETIAFIYTQGRRKAFSKETAIRRAATGALTVQRKLLYASEAPAGMEFPASEPLHAGESLFNALLPLVNRPGWDARTLAQWMAPLADHLRQQACGEPPVLPGRFLDATPSNFLLTANAPGHLIDLEWTGEASVDLDHVLWRGIYHSLKRVGTLAPPAAGTELRPDLLSAHAVTHLTGRKPDVNAFLQSEQQLQIQISNTPAKLTDLRNKLTERSIYASGSPTTQAYRPKGPLHQPRNMAQLRLAVVLHLFYIEYWPEFVEAFQHLPPQTKVFITTPAEHLEWVRKAAATDLPVARIFAAPNRGRDIGPLLALLNDVELESFDYVLKLHTKRSPHLIPGQGDHWRRQLLSSLLPPHRLPHLFAYLETHRDVGMVAPGQWLHTFDRTSDINTPLVEDLAGRIGFSLEQESFHYPMGTMFWARGEIFARLRALEIAGEDFPDEQGQLDGTLAHALERAMPLLAWQAGLTTSPLPHELGAEIVPPPSAMSLEQWLQARQLTPQHEQALSARWQEVPAPRIAVMVLNAQDDAEGLSATLKSVAAASRFGFLLECHVFGTPPADTALSGLPAQTLATVRVHSASGETGALSRLNEVAPTCNADWLLLLRAGDALTADGMARVALALPQEDNVPAVFADEIFRGAAGADLGAAFRPDMNLDLLLSFPTPLCRHWLWRRQHFTDMQGLSTQHPQAAELDLILRTIEAGGLPFVHHAAEPLVITDTPTAAPSAQEQQVLHAHLARRGYIHAQVQETHPGLYRVLYGHQDTPLVSIIVPTRNQLALVSRCVESVLEKTLYPHYEILLVDNQSDADDAVAWMQGIETMGEDRIRVIRYPHPFNYSAMNNLAASQARGDYLVLLNNDTAIIDPHWLDALLNHAQRPEVGAVGAKLLFPDGTIQHAGVILGLRGPAEHPFIGEKMDAPGAMQRLLADQNYSAVTAACLMVKKSAYFEVDGLDESDFRVSYNDIDFCLKLGRAGYLNVWTPHALVMHEGSASQKAALKEGWQSTYEKTADRFRAEQDALYSKWMPLIARDPAYNSNLSLQGQDFTFEARVELVRIPLDLGHAPRVLAHMADHWGCGHYRVIQPFKALQHNGLIDGLATDNALLPAELERFNPDVIVLQRPINEARLEAMRRMKLLSRAFKVYELDDYLPNLPIRSALRTGMPKDVLKSLRKGLSMVDRFVVSTPGLAQAFVGLHPDTRVIRNLLPTDWWSGLERRRRHASKPRVGWAGGIGHTGDLQVLTDVIKALSGEVEWVFFGMCPDELLPIIHELHTGVAIEKYPAKLASLDLDLALAPLEINPFNECKSNLRLLEYGACGFPVIATDIRPYREDGLPVTLVRNRFKDWMDAIRDHTHDLDAAAQAGKHLRDAVHKDWMLQGSGLQAWRQAWTPGD